MSIQNIIVATSEMKDKINHEISVSTERYDRLLEAVKAMKEGLEEIEVALMSERSARKEALLQLIALPHQE